MADDATQIFSKTYAEARMRFLEAASRANAAITSYSHHDRKGAEGEALIIDVATLGSADARRALVIMSGTHGIEGYCGSAIQTGLLRSGELGESAGSKIMLVHGINPFGFSYGRRVNEDNVDLNRNFIEFGTPRSNESYAILSRALHRPPTLFTRIALFGYILRHGFRAFQEAVTRGQYSFPNGLFFGGTAASWSRQRWSEILARDLGSVEGAFFIDFHTGLGKNGIGQILSSASPETTAGQAARAKAVEIFGDEVKFLTAENGRPHGASKDQEAVATQMTGDILNFTVESRPDGSFSGVYLEFGTLPPFSVLEAMMAENAGRLGSKDDAASPRGTNRLRSAFYPDDATWRDNVWARGRDVTLRALKALSLEASRSL